MYVVIGANGYMGAYAIKNILEKTNDEIIATSRSGEGKNSERVRWVKLDVTDDSDVLRLEREYLSAGDSNKIIYLAAYHNPNLVEKNPRLAWDINVTSLSRFINKISRVKSFFYPSTDSVYGESVNGRLFKETDELRPENFYGRNKIAAESVVTMYGYNVARFPFLIAPSLTDKKHFYDVIAESITAGEPFDMFSDSYRSSLDFNTAVSLMLDLSEKTAAGENIPSIINVCGDKALSKYDVGLMIADKLNVSRELIRPISIHEQSGIFEAKRAASSLMDNSLLKRTLNLSEINLSFEGF